MEEYKYDVFISYSRKDTKTADKICEALDRAGITYFIDRQGVGGGMEFPTVLSQAIRESKVFLFLASKNSYESKFTQSEIVYAFNKKQKQDIIPYIIDGSTLPEELAFTFSAINWRDVKHHPIDTVLVNDIRESVGKKEISPETFQPAPKPKFSGKMLAQIVFCISAVYFLFIIISKIASASYLYSFTNISIVLLFIIFILLLIGFIRPQSVDLDTRKDVAKFYLSSFFFFFIVAGLVASEKNYAISEDYQEEIPKTLVLYYSQTGNTKAVADEIAQKLDADIEEIVAVNPYDGDFQATIDRCKQEREQGILPDIQPIEADLADYDVIFLGYPVWFGTYAPPVITFLNNVDLSGKMIVPFCTFGSGGLESSVKDLTEKQPNAEILPGYGVRAARMEAMPQEVDQFLKANGFLEGEYTQLAGFPEQHPVSEEEAAIFDAAVDGYPMLHAKATSVAARTIPDGREYLFTAVDLPREDKPDMPPVGEMQVYVTVIDGTAPVFTKVIR